MKFFALIALAFLAGCASRFEKELMSRYPMQQWRSARHQGFEYNYDKQEAFVEAAQGDGPPRFFNTVFLPKEADVVYSFPGRYFYLNKKGTWHKFRFNDELDDIDELEATSYTRMVSWGEKNMIVGGFKADGSVDIITTYSGKLVVNLKGVDEKLPVAPAMHAAFVRMKDGTFRHILAENRPVNQTVYNWNFYPARFSLSPKVYLFAGEIQNIAVGIREVDGQSFVELFYLGAVVDLSKNREWARTSANEKYMSGLPDLSHLDFGIEPERRLVILRDGEATPVQYQELDSPKLRSLVWMKAQTGKPRGLGLLVPNEKGEIRIHSLSFTDYWGSQVHEYRQGTFSRSRTGVKDAMATFYVNPASYEEHPVLVFKGEDDRWNWSAGTLERERKQTGLSTSAVEKEGLSSLPEALQLVRSKCATFQRTPEEVAKAKLDYQARQYADGIRAREQYDEAIRLYEYRKKLAQYEADRQASSELREALGSISSSLTRGATSNTPKGPSGFDDRYNSTGDGWNRYQKHVEKEARRKALPGQN